MSDWMRIEQHISEVTGHPFVIERQSGVGGGCINQAYRIAGLLGGKEQRYFVKQNRANALEMFEAEAAGLLEMGETGTIRVPRPLCWGTTARNAYLVMEYIEMGRRGNAHLLGQQLAALHKVRRPRFGWDRDNTIGSTPQLNCWTESWIEFWRDYRLGVQLELAVRKGYGRRLQQQGEQLLAHFPMLFSDYQPQASLLHGDLWSGNCATDHEGSPVVYDPAVYYGDREADLAMTELFGGFGPDFMHGYNEEYPLDAGYAVRKTLYNLYHVLNHLNLFGGSYATQAEAMMGSLLSELR